MTETQVRTDIDFLKTYCTRRDAKYLRNLNRYMNNGQRREQIYELYNNPVAYYYQASDDDTGPWPIENVIKSCIDTKISKMSQLKVRPFINPTDGRWQTRKVSRIAQLHFDQYYQRHSVYHEAIDAYRDGQIFEVGHIWIDDESLEPRRIRPWEFYCDPAELHYKARSRIALRFWKYPMLKIKDWIGAGTPAWAKFQRDPHAKVDELWIYYDLNDKEKWIFADWERLNTRTGRPSEKPERETLKGGKKDIVFDVCPVASIYYVPPVKGMWSVALVDDLYTLQRELDVVNQKIHDATVLTPANLGLVPTVGGIKRSSLDAGREGVFYEYEPVSGTHAPVEWVTPAPVNPMLLKRRTDIIETMYNISGVSQLSAQAKKPSGLNSGVALDTLEDVESERHNREQQEYQRFCMDIAEIEIAIGDGFVLPAVTKKAERAKVTWKDVRTERDSYTIQFSPASILSGTPKVKMEEVEKLQKMGIIQPYEAAKYLEFPDLERAFAIGTANLDYVEAIVERAGDDHDFEYFEIVNVNDLFKFTCTEIMRLDADDPDNEEVIDNLVEFAKLLKGRIDMMNQAAMPMPAPAPPAAAPPVALGQPAAPPVPAAGPEASAAPGPAASAPAA